MERSTVIELLRRRCAETSARQVALDLGISEATLSRILSGKRQPGRRVARSLGYEAVTVFRPLPADER